MSARVAADLHVHTALSPCGDDQMRPPAMLLSAERRGVRVLGVVDHCSARNAAAVLGAAPAFDVRVFVGLEVESAEGVHILALFDTAEAALGLDRIVSEHLPPLPNRPEVLGEQLLLDEWGEVIGTDERLLAASTDLTIEEIAELTRAREGLSIPAHVDRVANGLLPTLGFVPPGLRVEAFELTRFTSPAAARERWPELRDETLITGSDAHYLADIGQAVTWISPELAEARISPLEWGRRLAEELRGWET
jgi:PHP family Zn ribbon phosphoesterase